MDMIFLGKCFHAILNEDEYVRTELLKSMRK